MSLVPYYPREGREVVLRHQNAIVVRDTSSQRLELRGPSDAEVCPACHQPLRQNSPERHGQFDVPTTHAPSFVDPNYFRMLRSGHDERSVDTPPSPVRRLVHPSASSAGPDFLGGSAGATEHDGAEFISSTPAVHEGSRIRRNAFSPNYFSTFFVEERELGRGGKGVVMLVRHEIDGCQLGHFACKRVPVGDDHSWLEKVLVEVELLAKLTHPNLVSYRHVWLEDTQLSRFGPPVACAFILQQYCNSGDLLHYIVGSQPREVTKEDLKARVRRRSRGDADAPAMQGSLRRLSFEEIYSLFRDITEGLHYLHANGYIHRDLKPSNCLLHKEGSTVRCLISDFGEVQPENQARRSSGSTGTISYCAPEVLRKDSHGRFGNFTTKSDIFSLGMILYFLCFGRLPYRHANMVNEELEDIDRLRAEIVAWEGFVEERRERPDLDGRLYQLLKKLVALDPAGRPSARDVLSAMSGGESSLDGMGRSGVRPASPGVGLQGHRIQSLDSPIVPGTPTQGNMSKAHLASASLTSVADPSKAPRPSALSREAILPRDGDLSAVPSSYAGPHSPSRKRGHDSRASSVSTSPSRIVADGPARRRGVDASPPAPRGPPLLMAPTITWRDGLWGRMQGAGFVGAGLFDSWGDALLALARLSLFLAKVASLSRPCRPYLPSSATGLVLLGMAAIDLSLPVATGGVGPVTTAIVHPRNRAWLVSATLVGLHFGILGISIRWGLLCAKSHDVWDRW